jgi:alpha-L-arabinofuranosidase
MTQTTVAVRPDEPIGTIHPRLYGHFAEHLARCCYDGLWVGTDERTIPNSGGFRTDVLAALRELPVPLLRWPGGCYADHYHWRDGIGPAERRPHRLGMSCGLQVEDDNGLGTHEFLRLCAELGAEPYLAGNVGSGTPQELCDWLEYCNSSADTTLTHERRTNGAAQPFGVPLWGVGNENWGCGGNYDAVTYAHEYRRYATMLRHVDPTAELVACGHDDAWNVKLLAELGRHTRLADHLSIHRYWNRSGHATDFDDDQYYALLTEASATEDFVRDTAGFIRDALQPGQRMGIALDEWGVWHPEARLPPESVGPEVRQAHTFEQVGTLRDALAAGIALEGFHRQCQVLTMANLAQIVNVLQAVIVTEGPRFWRTPTYHALRLHAPHLGATALPVGVDLGDSLPDGSPGVSATASRSASGLAVTLINRHRHLGTEVCLDGNLGFESASGELLTAAAPNAANCADQPDNVAPAPLTMHAEGHQMWRFDLPAHSMATVRLR